MYLTSKMVLFPAVTLQKPRILRQGILFIRTAIFPTGTLKQCCLQDRQNQVTRDNLSLVRCHKDNYILSLPQTPVHQAQDQSNYCYFIDNPRNSPSHFHQNTHPVFKTFSNLFALLAILPNKYALVRSMQRKIKYIERFQGYFMAGNNALLSQCTKLQT